MVVDCIVNILIGVLSSVFSVSGEGLSRMEGIIYRGWETQGVTVPRGKPYGSSPWCLGP
jgi:hypothetical protein